MPTLAPAPNTLGLASPALGPWFRHDDSSQTPPELPLPAGDLSCTVSLVENMEWRTPAGAIRSYWVATASRPPGLRALRRENGGPAFTTGSLVVVLTLLPEVELRLWALTQPAAQPDGRAAPAPNTPTRPRIRYLAAEIDASRVSSLPDLERLRPADFPSDLADDEAKAAFLGLTFGGGSFDNGPHPVTELCRPATSSAVALKNRNAAALPLKLWCFDHRGRALDPGSVAALWAHLAEPARWDNLWAHEDAEDQRTTAAAAGRFVHLVSFHEGPLASEIGARLTLNDLTRVTDSEQLYQVGSAPSIALTPAADADTDTAPIPRLAVLPNGVYTDPATATPLAGWTSTDTPFPMQRDFVRLALGDVESHLIGLTRADTVQKDPRRRVSAARNTAATPLLLTIDAVTSQVMASLSAGAAAVAMAPVMDTRWGAVSPAALGDDDLTDSAFDKLEFTAHAIAGEGAEAGGTVTGQRVVFKFDGTLPAQSWIRIWPHGRDTDTGRRYRQNGGAALADGTGTALVVVPIPDGTASSAADPVELSFDALLVTTAASRLYADQRYIRPVVAAGSRLVLPGDGSTPADTTLFLPEQGMAMSRGTNQLQSGQIVLAFEGPLEDDTFRLADMESLQPADLAEATLPNAAASGDTLITTSPAFGQTPEGTLDPTASPGGPARLHRARNALTELTTFGRPVPTQERLELVALERTGNTGVIGAAPGREPHHEAPPPRLAHPGVPAAEEVHGPGIALAGPATDPLVALMRERASADLVEFIAAAGTPLTPATDPGGPSTFAAILETMTSGVAGDAVLRAMAAITPSFTPGRTWDEIKSKIDDALGDGTLDDRLDTSSFDGDALAAAVDRVLHKTQSGASGFATAAQAAIGRAEDFLYIQTPAIDPHAAGGGAIDLVDAIKSRWTTRPGLRVMLCVPEKWLPNRTAKLEQIRKHGIGGALEALQADAADRVLLFSPIAGSGRSLHMASTTLIVDDAVLLSGSTHLWRRGLTFDSSLAVSLFDETVAAGRPAAIATARVQLLAIMLGLTTDLIPRDPEDCFNALLQLSRSGGLGRVKPGVYVAQPDPTTAGDLDAWNPDGRALRNWFTFFAALTGPAAIELSNAIR